MNIADICNVIKETDIPMNSKIRVRVSGQFHLNLSMTRVGKFLNAVYLNKDYEFGSSEEVVTNVSDFLRYSKENKTHAEIIPVYTDDAYEPEYTTNIVSVENRNSALIIWLKER